MKPRELWLAVLALVASVATAIGVKWGKRGADKRVADVAVKAADKMQEEVDDDKDKDLAEIDSRPVTDDPVADLRERLRRPAP